MIPGPVAVTVPIAISIPAWPQDGVQFRGHQRGWSQGSEQDLEVKPMHTRIDHGRTWLAAQSSAEPVYTCASGCAVRADGPSTRKRLCESDRKIRQCRDGTLEIPRRPAAP